MADGAELARLAYERGRLLAALGWAAPALVVASGALWVGRPVVEVAGYGLAAFGVAAWAAWRGQGWQDGVAPGLAIGAVPVVAALVATRLIGHCTAELCAQVCVGTTLLGGAGVGVFLADRARLRKERWRRVLLSSGMVAGLLAPLGCQAMTVGAAVGLVVGVVAGALPAALLPARSR